MRDSMKDAFSDIEIIRKTTEAKKEVHSFDIGFILIFTLLGNLLVWLMTVILSPIWGPIYLLGFVYNKFFPDNVQAILSDREESERGECGP